MSTEEEHGLSSDAFARLTEATRRADELFMSGETGGGGTRHWLRDCFFPLLENEGLRIVDARPAVPSSSESGKEEKGDV